MANLRNVLIKLTGDGSDATRTIGTVKDELVDLAKTRVEPSIRLQTIGLQQQIAKEKARLENLAKQPITPEVAIRVGRSAATIDRLEARLHGLDEKAFHPTISPRVKDFAGDIARTIRRGVTLGAGAAGAGAVFGGAEVVRSGLQFNAQVESGRLALRRFVGDAKTTREFVNDLLETSKRTPFEFTDILGASRRLLAFGLDAEQVKKTMSGIGDAVAAAGGGAEQIQQISLALGQIQAKGRLQGDEVLQLTEAGIPALRILKDELGLTNDQVANIGKQNIPAATAIKALTDGMTRDFKGAAEEQSKTFAGMTSTLKDNWAQTTGAMTSGLFDELKQWTPAVNQTLGEITGIFNRKDLDFGEKIRLSEQAVRRNLAPLAREVRRAITNADLDGRLERAVEVAAPKMIDALAAAAPRAAGAFVRAFRDAGPWGKLITVAFLLSKLGAFRAAGSWAGGILVSRIRSTLRNDTSMEGAAGAAGRRSGRTYAAQTAATGAERIEGAAAPGGRLGRASSRAGRVAGRAMGLAGAAAFIIAFTPEITSFLREFGERIKSATNKDANGKSFLDGLGDFFLDPFRGKGGSKQDLIDRVTGGPFPTGQGGAGLTRPGSGLGGLPRQARPDEGLAPIDESTTSRTRRRKGKASKTRNGVRVTTDPGVETTVAMDDLGTLNVRRLIVARAEGLAGVSGGTGGGGTASGSTVGAGTARTRSAEQAAQDYYDGLRQRRSRQTAAAVAAMSSVGVLGNVAKFEDVNVDTTALRSFLAGKSSAKAQAHINVEKIEVAALKGQAEDPRRAAVLLARELERRGGR